MVEFVYSPIFSVHIAGDVLFHSFNYENDLSIYHPTYHSSFRFCPRIRQSGSY